MFEDKEVLTVSETAKVLRVSLPCVYKNIRLGKIPSIRLGDRQLVPVVQLRKLLAGEL